MNKKLIYYFVFLIIPSYLFGGLIIEHIKYGNKIVNSLEMPENYYDNKPSQYSDYEASPDKLKKPVIEDSIKISWLLRIQYIDYNQIKRELSDLGFDRIYRSFKKKKELLLGPFVDREIAEYIKKELEKNLSVNITLKKITN